MPVEPSVRKRVGPNLSSWLMVCRRSDASVPREQLLRAGFVRTALMPFALIGASRLCLVYLPGRLHCERGPVRAVPGQQLLRQRTAVRLSEPIHVPGRLPEHGVMRVPAWNLCRFRSLHPLPGRKLLRGGVCHVQHGHRRLPAR